MITLALGAIAAGALTAAAVWTWIDDMRRDHAYAHDEAMRRARVDARRRHPSNRSRP